MDAQRCDFSYVKLDDAELILQKLKSPSEAYNMQRYRFEDICQVAPMETSLRMLKTYNPEMNVSIIIYQMLS